jgi:hypothetical protein
MISGASSNIDCREREPERPQCMLMLTPTLFSCSDTVRLLSVPGSENTPGPGSNQISLNTVGKHGASNPYAHSPSSSKTTSFSTEARDLPWNDKPSKGGYQGNNLDAGNHQMGHADMQAQARGEYSKRTEGAGHISPPFRSSVPRLKTADAYEAFTPLNRPNLTRVGQLSSYDTGVSGRGAGKGHNLSSSFGSTAPRLSYHTTLEKREGTMPAPGSYSTPGERD